MFGKPVPDEGCGKWLSTKATRKIARSVKNTKGSKKTNRKSVILQNDHVPGAALSTSPMSPQELEMLSRLSRAKQAKMDQFFKPLASKDLKSKDNWDDVGSGFESIDQERSDSVSRATSRKHQLLTTDSEEFPTWEDYSYPYNENSAVNSFPRSSGKQNQNEQCDPSGVLPTEDPAKVYSVGENPDGNISSYTPTRPNEQEVLPNPDEHIKSPIAKRLKNMGEESPPNSNDYSEMDSGSFRYSQWVKQQINKSKDLQKYFLIDDKSDGVTTCTKDNAKSQQKSNIFESESEFYFTEWRKGQESKCKKLQECMELKHIKKSELEHDCDQEQKLDEKNETALENENTLTDSHFRFTEWVGKQKSKCKDVHKSFDIPDSTKSQTVYNTEKKCCQESEIHCIPESVNFQDGYSSQKKSLRESETRCIPESENFQAVCGPQKKSLTKSEIHCIPETEIFDFENISPKTGDLNSEFETENKKSNMQGKVINMRLSTTTVLKDVSNLYKERKTKDSKNLANKYEIKMNKISSQESEAFQFTEWVQNQHQISKLIQKEPQALQSDGKFWEIPDIDNKNCNEKCCTVDKKSVLVVLASDTDQESDTEESNFSL